MSFRTFTGAALAAAIACVLSLPATAVAQQPEHRFEIAGQELGDALRAFAQASGQQITFDSADVRGKVALPLSGDYTVEAGLRRLLEGTNLVPRRTQNGVLYVVDPSRHDSDGGPRPGTDADRLGRANDKAITFDQIIVTAQKRESRLQETPVTLSVLGSTQLAQRGLVSGTDYLSTVPGTYIASWGVGNNQLVMRGLGLSTGQSPTAGAYLGDLPLSDALSYAMTDVKLVDMERVEILRGPQGTLYGSGALGGAVRNIPVAPGLDDWEASARLGTHTIDGAGKPGFSAVGILNAPLKAGVAALRVAAYKFKKPGYVDEISTPAIQALSQTMQLPVSLVRDKGGNEYDGIRAILALQASDRTKVSLMMGYQELFEDGASEVRMSTRRYADTVLDMEDDYRNQVFKYANLLIEHDVGWGVWTSSSSWTSTWNDSQFNQTRLIPTASLVPITNDKDSLFQEVRLATNWTGPFQLVAGGYYERIKFKSETNIRWASPNLAALSAFWGTSDPEIMSIYPRSDLTQLAFFGEFNYAITDRWMLRAGGRWFDYERHDSSVSYHGVAPGVPRTTVDTGDLPVEEQGRIYKLGVDYKPAEHVLFYGIASQGFRLGQTIDSTATFIAYRDACDQNDDGFIDGTSYPFSRKTTLLSDRLNNYELGGKFALGNRAQVNVAAYRIDWDDLPVSVFVAGRDGLGCSATFNGGGARTQGLELDSIFRLTPSLQLEVSGSYNQSEYRDNLAGKQGQKLPFSPKYNGNIGLRYGFDLQGRPAYLRSDLSYVGVTQTPHAPPDIFMTEAYYKLGIRAGIGLGRVDVEIYGTNLTNKNALVGVFNLDRGWRLEPRTLGVEVSFHY